jgi:hypothetical protein
MLKLKMWPLYWPSLFFRSFLVLIIFCCFGNAYANKLTSKQPGIIESLELLVELQKKQYKLLNSKVRRNPKVLSNISKLKSIYLHPFFMRSILFNSDDKYLNLAKKNKCLFYSLIENDLLKTAEGRIQNVIVNFTTTDGKKESAVLTKNDFIKQVYKRECPNKKETSLLFENQNLVSTLKKITLPVPQTINDCETILEDWQRNPYTPYLCRIPEALRLSDIARKRLKRTENTNFSKRRYFVELIRKGDFFKGKIPYFERSYLNNLCYGLSNKEKFCQPYISDDVWSKVISGEFPTYLLAPKCRAAMKKNKLTKAQLTSCASKFKTEPKYCINKGKGDFKSFSPMPDCETISDSLMVSQLETNYHDCPAYIDNEGMINVHRIINHLKGEKVISTPSTCVNEVNQNFANLLFDFNYEKGWPLKLCYMDKIEDKERCDSYIPGNNDLDKMSESNVVSSILHRTRGLPSNTKCELISMKKFNPNFLQYKTGCYIVYEPEECTVQLCPKKILFNLREIKDIKYVGKQEFDYFATDFKKEKFSLSNILKETFKLKDSKIRNFTELIYFLDRKPANIVHGIGCAEDIIPAFFSKKSFNQCTPLPFIIDGYLKDGSQVKMVTRLAIDDIHSPRQIPWNFIFNSIASYKVLHPLDTWTLYGIQQRKSNGQ